jgi:hypothetical protein
MGNLLDVIQRFRLKNEIRKLKKGVTGPNPDLRNSAELDKF